MDKTNNIVVSNESARLFLASNGLVWNGNLVNIDNTGDGLGHIFYREHTSLQDEFAPCEMFLEAKNFREDVDGNFVYISIDLDNEKCVLNNIVVLDTENKKLCPLGSMKLEKKFNTRWKYFAEAYLERLYSKNQIEEEFKNSCSNEAIKKYEKSKFNRAKKNLTLCVPKVDAKVLFQYNKNLEIEEKAFENLNDKDLNNFPCDALLSAEEQKAVNSLLSRNVKNHKWYENANYVDYSKEISALKLVLDEIEKKYGSKAKAFNDMEYVGIRDQINLYRKAMEYTYSKSQIKEENREK